MKLKTKYIIFVSITLLSFSILTAFLYNYNRFLFILGEGIIVVSIVLSVSFYKSLIRPFKLLNSGIESISDKDFSIKFLPVGQPEPDRLIEVYNKMIDQLRQERIKATETHFFLQKLIEASPAGIIVLNTKNKIQSINAAAQNIFNLNFEDKEFEINDLASPWNKELAIIQENTSSVVQINGINQFKCYCSSFLDRGVKRTFFLIEELTQELLHAERQAYEKVIRMISHEINNSMGAVSSIIDSTLYYIRNPKNNTTPDYINALDVAKERINNLNSFTKRFAEVVRIPHPEIKNCNLDDIINRVLIYFQTELSQKNIDTETNFAHSQEVVIQFDIQQLELVLINIIKNAIQAIGTHGNINIYTSRSPLSLIIENDGEPISKDIMEKLFTPFFTTKKTGQGIGLTLIREILVNHKCKFYLHTRKDNFTEFKILFMELSQ
jgi:nitrogen fixation/metabolism regulation signal transduction histidine kinase